MFLLKCKKYFLLNTPIIRQDLTKNNLFIFSLFFLCFPMLFHVYVTLLRRMHILETKEQEAHPMWENRFGQELQPGMIHVVKAGETLYELSRKYHVSVADLMCANPYLNVYQLREGDEMVIPVGKAKS